jgi:hypothetical protein
VATSLTPKAHEGGNNLLCWLRVRLRLVLPFS